MLTFEEKQHLEQIEDELLNLVNSDKTSWVRIYELMDEVEKHGLFADKYNSFTAWVNDFATKSKVHVSLLWNRKKAGKMYSDYEARAKEKGKAVPTIAEVAVSPDNFILIEKIAGNNTSIADDLTSKVIAGQLTRKDLSNAWATKRADKNNVRVNRYDKQKETISNEAGEPDVSKITALDIVFALGRSSWLQDKITKEYQEDKYRQLTEFAVNTGTTHNARRIDSLVLENHTTKQRGELNMHGIEIKVSKSDLLNDGKMQEYCDFVDYFWIAVPEELVADAKLVKLHTWGIIVIKKDESGNYIAERVTDAARLNPVFREDTLQSAVLKLL